MEVKKHILICIHGFINDERHDLQDFYNYYSKVKVDPDTEIKLFFLYDPTNPKSYSHKKMYKKLYSFCKDYCDQGYDVSLLAYSFSCGIAAHVASKLPISKIAFVGPAIYLLRTRLLVQYLQVAYKDIKIRIKHGKKAARIMERLKTKGVIRLSFNISVAIFRNRKYFHKVRQPAFLCKGDLDSHCIGNSLGWVSKKLRTVDQTIRVYPNGTHFMIMHYEDGKEAFDDLFEFFFLIPNPTKKLTQEINLLNIKKKLQAIEKEKKNQK